MWYDGGKKAGIRNTEKYTNYREITTLEEACGHQFCWEEGLGEKGTKFSFSRIWSQLITKMEISRNSNIIKLFTNMKKTTEEKAINMESVWLYFLPFLFSPLFPFLSRLQSDHSILLTGVLLQLCSFPHLSLYASFWIVSIDVSSSSLIFSSVVLNLLFMPFNFF